MLPQNMHEARRHFGIRAREAREALGIKYDESTNVRETREIREWSFRFFIVAANGVFRFYGIPPVEISDSGLKMREKQREAEREGERERESEIRGNETEGVILRVVNS